jgi:hypothetical protein
MLVMADSTQHYFGINLPKEMVERIDMDRGDIPRGKFILRIIEKHYGGKKK